MTTGNKILELDAISNDNYIVYFDDDTDGYPVQEISGLEDEVMLMKIKEGGQKKPSYYRSGTVEAKEVTMTINVRVAVDKFEEIYQEYNPIYKKNMSKSEHQRKIKKIVVKWKNANDTDTIKATLIDCKIFKRSLTDSKGNDNNTPLQKKFSIMPEQIKIGNPAR